MKTVFVLYGGPSVEHNVSVNSTRAVINALDRSKYRVIPVYITEQGEWIALPEAKETFETTEPMIPEIPGNGPGKSLAKFLSDYDVNDGNSVFFPVLHGTYGEDGSVQGFLETLDVPYVGSGVTASALCMDKAFANMVLEQNNIPQAKFHVLNRLDVLRDGIDGDAIVEKLGLPLYVKPANCGSSIGVVRVTDASDLSSAVDEAMQYDDKVVLEEEIWGRELNVSVIGNDDPMGSVPADYAMETGFFDFDLKYNNPAIVPVIPAPIPVEEQKKVSDMAVRAYIATDCRGLARIDVFRMDDGTLKVNEINTMPGMSALSMTPVLWNATNGMQYPALLDRFIEWGLEDYARKKAIVRESL